jgi:multiple sugar transport system substrate-binding protein
MSKKYIAALIGVAMFIILLCGCGAESVRLNPKTPLSLTLWHNYGGQMQSSMDELIDEFNMTIGREKGIIVSVTAVSAMKEQEERLAMIAAGDPGAEAMPDIVTAYPKTAMLLSEQGMLAAFDDKFSKEELADYVPQFIEEGRLPDGKLYVFPIAKSSEMLFVNQTLFDRFSAATGVSMDSLSTFEGIAEAALKYYEWTDSMTPEVPQDGKTFYTADSWFNIAQAGMAQLGGTFASPDELLVDAPQYKRIWEFCMQPALLGGYAVIDGYSSDLSKTGDIVCSTGSTAGILFYGDSITYPDNSSEEAVYSILPYPVFDGGEKIAIQRGAGMVVASSTPEKEYAATLFLKWFTHPAQNIRFISSTGYLPVTNEAYNEIVEHHAQPAENANIQKMLQTAIRMHGEYTFLTAPNYNGFDAMSKQYEADLKEAMRSGRQRVLTGEAAQDVCADLRENFMH